MNNKFYFGTHINSYKNLIDAVEKIKSVGGNLIQIFLSKPDKSLDMEKDQMLKFKQYLKKNNIMIIIHSSYTHNIASDWDKHSWWIKNLELELFYAHKLGASALVLHLGKYLELSQEEAFNNMYTCLVYIHNRTKEYKNIKILLETSSGQGTEMCYRLEELSRFFKKFSKNDNKELKDRIKLCVDTCHIFAAGYNLKTETDVKLYLEAFNELIGINNIYLIHLNDSVVDVGCRRDRHENIGKGFIGLDGLTYFFNYFKRLKVPIVLETPSAGYIYEIPLLLNSKI